MSSYWTKRRRIHADIQRGIEAIGEESNDDLESSSNDLANFSNVDPLLVANSDISENPAEYSSSDYPEQSTHESDNFLGDLFEQSLLCLSDHREIDTYEHEHVRITSALSNDSCCDVAVEENLADQLHVWAIKNAITHCALSDLLVILKTRHPSLPKDARTLLKTPTTDKTKHKIKTLSGFQRHVLKSLAEMKFTIADLASSSRQIDLKLDKNLRNREGVSATKRLPDDIQLPLTTLQEIEYLEEKLSDDQMQDSMIAHLASVGGASVKECTVRVMRRLITDTCAKQFNWKGKGYKRAFSRVKLKKIVIGAVQNNILTSKASDLEVETIIKNFLKFAGERDGGRKQRQERRRVEQPQEDNCGIAL